MSASNLKVVEKKVLGAMLIHTDEDMIVQTGTAGLAKTMGYKASGGAVTFAIQALEMKNFIFIEGKTIKVLL